jgi:uncharacterized protein YciW
MLDNTIEVIDNHTLSINTRNELADEVVNMTNNNSLRKYLNNMLRPQPKREASPELQP